MGEGGEALYEWVVGSDDEVDADVLRAATEATQALSAAGDKDVFVTYRVCSRV